MILTVQLTTAGGFDKKEFNIAICLNSIYDHIVGRKVTVLLIGEYAWSILSASYDDRDDEIAKI
ncbi:MAG: hypothetical protein WA667_01740 [Candidatus Nitrosopolaris sp.]